MLFFMELAKSYFLSIPCKFFIVSLNLHGNVMIFIS